LHKEESSKRVMHIQVDHSAWDRWLSLNPHALIIYFNFFFTCATIPERFEKCWCENDDVHFHCRTWISDDGYYHWLQSPINPFSMEHWIKYLICTIVAFWIFFNCDLSSLSYLLSLKSLKAIQVKMLLFKFNSSSI